MVHFWVFAGMLLERVLVAPSVEVGFRDREEVVEEKGRRRRVRKVGRMWDVEEAICWRGFVVVVVRV